MDLDIENRAEIFKNMIIYNLNNDSITLDQFIELLYENITFGSIPPPHLKERFIVTIKKHIVNGTENKFLGLPISININKICKQINATYNPLTETIKLNKVVKI